MSRVRAIAARIIAMLSRRSREQRLQEEFAEHLEMMTEENIRQGMSPAEARRAAILKFGAVESLKDSWREQSSLPLVEAFVRDAWYGLRQLRRHPTASVAAILSLALATGAATAAFRLVDAVLLRTLPVSEPDRLYYVGTTTIDRDGRSDYMDDFDYPTYRRYRDALAGRAEAMVVGMVARQDATIGKGEPEKVYRQFLSGNVFRVFGLQPALGRLLASSDDVKPGGHPVAVLSHDFWTRRFGADRNVIGQLIRLASERYEIVGVAPRGFTGTEPGETTDIFLPAMMNASAINSPGWSWFRLWVQPSRGYSADQVREQLQAVFINEQRERIKRFHSDTPRDAIESALRQRVLLLPAAHGASDLQKSFRQPLLILCSLVALVLLVATVNVANLLMAQAAARSREMALRVSLGAGRRRLLQMLLVQSGWLALAAVVLGALVAAWAVPLVTSMLRVPSDPVRIVFTTGWREVGFSAALTIGVTLLFGLAPALRASAVHPAAALKGNEELPSRRGMMNGLIAAQVGFCILVVFVAGLFLHSFQRLVTRPLGFNADRLLVADTSSAKQESVESWMQVAERIRSIPGVESVAFSNWALLSGNRWTASIRVPGKAMESQSPYVLGVSPGFHQTMRIGLLSGREFRVGDLPPAIADNGKPTSGAGIVNEAFARTFLDGVNPVGRVIEMRVSKDTAAAVEIVGYVRDAVYQNVREKPRPTIYLPLTARNGNTFLVRTTGDPMAVAASLRHEVGRAGSGFRIRNINQQADYVTWHLLRERLLAALSSFFGGVALLLAAIGLYGVLNYTVARQQREIGIRMALGARPPHVIHRIVSDIGIMIGIGAAVGLMAGLAGARLIGTLLFEVKATDPVSIMTPVLTLAAVAFVAGLPPALRAIRIDPAHTLRGE